MKIQSKEFTLYKRVLMVLGGGLVLELLFCGFKYLSNSGHVTLWAAMAVVLMACLGVLIDIYYRQEFPFECVGVENMQRLGAQLTPEQRDKLWSKGKLTLYQWDVACRQANQGDIFNGKVTQKSDFE